ncbi:substrate-binding domain-containing protein [uncultured Tateyamaria sp.]|uniref:substrate-binding domain-containing protein n=1 Tax=uncultured Tateyamaria sp. TaxID=455651 RepID=UPI00260A6E16|nr:substrate-binding domain-containing protein [uncultured Tateyamaria sp.]
MNLKELSHLLGISQTTVSRALNGYPEVSEATRARVIAAAQAHNYSPNTRAQGLATGHSRCIGHVISVNDSGEMVNPIFGDFMAGAGETYAAHGYDMMMTRVGAQDESDTYRNLQARGAVDGLVVHAPRNSDARLPLLTEIGLPFVVHGRSTGTDLDYSWLDVNNRRAFQDAARYLVSLGHSRIGLINGQETLDFAIRRREGYVSALAEAGLSVDPTLMVSGEMTEKYGFASASAMLDLPNPPSAFLVSSIICAVGVRRALDARDLKQGSDVSIVTFDDCLSYFANGSETPVFTAMQSSVRAAGAALAQMLIDRINTPDAPHTQTLWEADFVIGPSTGPYKSPHTKD